VARRHLATENDSLGHVHATDDNRDWATTMTNSSKLFYLLKKKKTTTTMTTMKK